VPLPLAGLRAGLRAEEALAGPASLLTWDDAQMLAVEMLSQHGTRDVRALGVSPRGLQEVLAGGAAPTASPSPSARRPAAAGPR
jgi:hypothetical protein